MWNTRQTEIYQQLMRRFFQERVLVLYAKGKSVQEIHKMLTPWGSTYPSSVAGFINATINTAIARGQIEEVKQDA